MVERKISLDGFHPLRFFSKLGTKEKNVVFFTSGEWSILCWNPTKTIQGNDASIFIKLKKLPKNTSSLPFSGGAIGYCSYDLGCVLQGVGSRHRFQLPLAVFHAYDQAVLWNGKDLFVVGNDRFMNEVVSIHGRQCIDDVLPRIDWTSQLSKKEYRKKFTRVMGGIMDGEFYQLNLSYPFQTDVKLDRRRLFASLAEAHPAPCAAYFEHDDTSIISLSPERFVTIKNRIITTQPIKGTRPRGATPAADKRLAAELMASTKEAAELNMITDLLRNDIGKVSETGSVKVLEHRAPQKNLSVWHTYSVISGRLEKSIHPLDAFASMFPGGSITGCPKVAAMKEIDRVEDSARGAYCGSLLLLGKNGFLDSSILIRTISSHKNTLTLGMGGGIVADSGYHSEFDETLKKAQPFLNFSLLNVPRYFRGQREIQAESVARLFDSRNAKISGVFETMRAEAGKIQDLALHLTRLHRSAELLSLQIPSAAILKKNLRSAVKIISGKFLRVKLVCTNNDCVVEIRVLRSDPARKNGISVMIVPLQRALAEAKSLPYHRETAAHDAALHQGFGEALLKRHDGSISEGAYSNVFFVKDGTLWTADFDILFGITRRTVIRLAKRLHIPVRFVSLQSSDLLHSDEIFLTSSLTGITPVLHIGSDPVGDGSPGRITKTLQKALSQSNTL